MYDLQLIFFFSSAFVFSAVLAFYIILMATSKGYPVIFRSKREHYFVDPITGKEFPFPSLNDQPSVHLTVVVPAYNEESRLPPMLDECIEFLENRKTPDFRYEIIVVSDGSTDKTVAIANKYCENLGTDKLRVLALETNRGKGGAVRLGVLSARGATVLFADADGATKFADLVKLETGLQEFTECDYLINSEEAATKQAICVGSRTHLEDAAVATRTVFRTFLMYGFHFLVWLFAVRGIRDTQCGFKLLTRAAARSCFQSLHVEKWAFDVELLYIAQRLNIPIKEVAVNWTEIEGSKVTPVWSWIQMGKDLFFIWLRYTIGAWKIAAVKNE